MSCVIVGDVVGERRDLRFRRRPGVELQASPLRAALHATSATAPAFAPPRGPLCLASPSSVSHVRLRPSKAAYLRSSAVTTRKALGVVIEAAEVAHHGVERPLAGVPERRVAEVVRERQRLGEILVEAQLAGDGARDLRHLEASGSGGCGSGRPRGTRTPASCR